MNNKTPSPCGPDCKCDPCACNDAAKESSCCSNMRQQHCHSGHRFWFWAIIRISIVILLIIGAFCLGIRLGTGIYTHGFGYGDGGYAGRGYNMMNDYYPDSSYGMMRGDGRNYRQQYYVPQNTSPSVQVQKTVSGSGTATKTNSGVQPTMSGNIR